MSAIASSLRETEHRPWPLPKRPWAMAMSWHDLLFAHWEVDPALLERALPEPLTPDLFEGRAYVGVVPFRMSGVRARFLPPVPGCGAFPELNVRTYVTVGGKPGVYFFSLDATCTPAIETARRTFALNYLKSRMACAREGDSVTYACARTDRRAPPGEFRGVYAPVSEPFHAEAGSLEHFLTERYALYTASGGIVRRGEIHHPRWPLRRARAEIRTCDMTRLLDLALEGPACSLLFVDRIDVPAWLPVRTDREDA
ncbi:MAG: YqjF family protein [Phycisphaerales bacterium JB040]